MNSSIESKVIPFGHAVDVLEEFIASSDEVETPGGPLPGLRKLVGDMKQAAAASVESHIGDFVTSVGQVQDAAAEAKQHKDEAAASLTAALAAGKVFDSANAAATASSPVINVGDTAWIRPNATDRLTRITAMKRISGGTDITAFQIDQSFATGDEIDATNQDVVDLAAQFIQLNTAVINQFIA